MDTTAGGGALDEIACGGVVWCCRWLSGVLLNLGYFC